MKKIYLLLIAALFFAMHSYAQNTFPSTGNVGIGTTTPNALFTVYQLSGLGATIKANSLLSTISGNVGSGNTFHHNTWLVRNNAGNDWLTSRIHDGISIDGSFLSPPPKLIPGHGGKGTPIKISNRGGDQQNTYLIINQGNVGIGTVNPDSKLAVNGTIHSKEVKVDMNGWADHVFKPSYNLLSLSQVKHYIDQNKHLPDMPSETEVAKDGVNLGEMNKLLLKKVEELTLYLIEKDKQLKVQHKKTLDLEERVKRVEKFQKCK